MSATTGITLTISADTSNAIRNLEIFASKITGLNGLLEGMGALALEAFSIHTMARWVAGAAEAAAAMNRLAEKTGVAVAQLSTLGYAAKLNHVSTEELGLGLKMLAVHTDEANHKGGAAAVSFNRLGIAVADAGGHTRNAADVMADIAEKFKTMPDGAEKTALAVEFFGRAGQNLIPMLRGGREEISKLAQEASALGANVTPQLAESSEHYEQNLTRLRAAAGGFANDLAGQVLPRLNHLLERFLEFIKSLRQSPELLSAVEKGVDLLSAALLILAARMAAIKGLALLGSLGGLGKLGAFLGTELPAYIALGTESVAGFTYVIGELTAVASRALLPLAALFGVFQIGKTAVALVELHGAQNQVAEATSAAEKSFTRLNQTLQKQVDLLNGVKAITPELADVFRKTLAKADDDFANGLISLQKRGEILTGLSKVLADLRDHSGLAETKPAAATAAADDAHALVLEQEQVLAMARANREVGAAMAALDEQQEATAYERKLLALKYYFQKRRETLESENANQASELSAALALNAGQMAEAKQKLAAIDQSTPEGKKAAAEEADKIAKLKTERIELEGRQLAQSFEAKAKLAKLDTEQDAKAREELLKSVDARKEALQLTRDQFAAERDAVQNNFRLTDEEKRQQEIKLLTEEKAAVDQLIASLKEKQKLDPANATTLEGPIVSLSNESRGIGKELSRKTGEPDPNSFTDKFADKIKNLQKQMGTVAQNTASLFSSVFNSAVSSISNGISGLIMGTKTWGQALREIYNSIINEIVQAIVQMGVRWVMTQVMMAVMGRSILAAATAATAPLAAAQAAIWVAPATLATIATLGASALAAPGFIGAAEAMTLGLSAFAEGGRPEPGQLALVGERGPELFIPDVAGTIIPAHQTAAMLQGGGSRAAAGGGHGAPGTTVNLDTPIFFDMNKVVEHLSRSDAHEKRILDVMSRNIHKFRG